MFLFIDGVLILFTALEIYGWGLTIEYVRPFLPRIRMVNYAEKRI